MDEKAKVLEKLAFDPNEYIFIERLNFARQGKYLSVLINDEDDVIRAEVAKRGYGLDKLINDESWLVRKTVAEQGYGLDILINDKNLRVREIAEVMLIENGASDKI